MKMLEISPGNWGRVGYRFYKTIWKCDYKNIELGKDLIIEIEHHTQINHH